jgi:hypothetical protein
MELAADGAHSRPLADHERKPFVFVFEQVAAAFRSCVTGVL